MANFPNKAEDPPRTGVLENQAPEGDSVPARSHKGPAPGALPLPIGGKTIKLAIAALGVVYGDIGTSPLYAVQECFNGSHAVSLNEVNLFGVVSLIFWSLTIVVTIKYVGFILRADNHGEGGIFALLGLIADSNATLSPQMRSAVFLVDRPLRGPSEAAPRSVQQTGLQSHPLIGEPSPKMHTIEHARGWGFSERS